MLVFHFLEARYAIDDLTLGRLKISRLTDLNDPFELMAVDLGDKNARAAFAKMRDELSKNRGVLCFAKTWHNPVMWSHYGDRHRGMCLGFEVPDDILTEINYDANRLIDVIPRLLTGPHASREDAMKLVLSTKYRDWQYEDEVRAYTSLDTPDLVNGLYFADFCPNLVLRKVVLGPRCGSVKKDDLMLAVRRFGSGIEIIESRLAFKSFDVVPLKGGTAIT